MAEACDQSKPTVATLDEQLRELVYWETFGIQLRGIRYEDIETIERNKVGNNPGQKLALYNKWLKVCPNASWSDVVIALEKAKEHTLAEQVKSLHNNEQCDERQKEIKLTEEEEITIISKLEYFSSKFSNLLTRTSERIKEIIESKQFTLREVTLRLENALHFLPTTGLKNCTQVEEIVDILRQQSHFLDGSILKIAIENLISSSPLSRDMNEYIERVQAFKLLKTIRDLEDKLKESNIGKNRIPITIKLSPICGQMYIQLVQNLIRNLLQLKGDIQWITVTSGSVQIIISVPKEEENRIINTSSQKEDFMKQMGIFKLQIGTNTILDTQENNHYSFESSLFEACAVGNIETVQFLLHYQFLQHISVDVDHTNEEGETPLMIASKNGHGNIVKLLLSANANVNKQDNTGQTAVMLAKTIEIYQTLVHANADTTIVTHDESTPLLISCLLGNHKVAEHLLFTLKHNITTRPDGLTLLMAASHGGNYRIVQYLLEKENDPNIQDEDGQTAIRQACLNGYYALTELLLKHNADPNLPGHDGGTPLIAASNQGHSTIVELLLQNGVDPNVTNTIHRTALWLASFNGHHDTVELLLMKGAEPNIQEEDGETAIFRTCHQDLYTVTELLLKHNADPNLPTHDGWTPLMTASSLGHIKIVELLLQNGVDPNVTDAKHRTALMLASDKGHHDTVELLLMKGADPNIQEDGETAILRGCYNGHYTVTELLLKHNADPNLPEHYGWTPLIFASMQGHSRIVELLLPRVSDLTAINIKNGATALMVASLNGHHETVKILLNARHNPNNHSRNGLTALQWSSIKGHYTVTELLLDNNADPNLADYEGRTPLMFASQKGCYKIVQLLLLQKGVKPNITNSETGTTPLIYATENGHHDTVETLLKARGNPNIKNKDGRSAIELASLYGHFKIVQLLLNYNADPNLSTNDGWTPLMAASQEGYTNIVELLLQKGVDPNVRNKRNGKTALIQASKNGHYDTVQLLIKAGCDSSIEDYEGHTATEQAHDEVLELLQNSATNQTTPSTDRQLVSPPKS